VSVAHWQGRCAKAGGRGEGVLDEMAWKDDEHFCDESKPFAFHSLHCHRLESSDSYNFEALYLFHIPSTFTLKMSEFLHTFCYCLLSYNEIYFLQTASTEFYILLTVRFDFTSSR